MALPFVASLARRSLVAATILLATAGVTAAAVESATELATTAMRECEQGQVATTRDQRVAHFERGQALAERAVALDEKLPTAHFAVFCNLGEMLRVDGEKVTSLLGFRKMMQALDRTLELNPNHLDALSSK